MAMAAVLLKAILVTVPLIINSAGQIKDGKTQLGLTQAPPPEQMASGSCPGDSAMNVPPEK